MSSNTGVWARAEDGRMTDVMGALMAAERETLLEMTRPPNTILSETVK